MTDKDKKDKIGSKEWMEDPKWGGTMRDVRDRMSKGEGEPTDKFYPFDGNPNNNPNNVPFNSLSKRKGCLAKLLGL